MTIGEEMTIGDLLWIDIYKKKIRRSSWPKEDYLFVLGWSYAGIDFAYEPSGETPFGFLHFGKDKRVPFHITPGHKGNDWEFYDLPPENRFLNRSVR